MESDGNASLPHIRRRWRRCQRLHSESAELLACAASVFILLPLVTVAKAQQVAIQTSGTTLPPFSVRCTLLDNALDAANKGCGDLFPSAEIEKVELTFSGSLRQVCEESIREMTFELNKLLNYLVHKCPKNPGANEEPFRLPTLLYFNSYNKHCTPTFTTPFTHFTLSMYVRCVTQRAPERPTGESAASPSTISNDQKTSSITVSTTLAPAATTAQHSSTAISTIMTTLPTSTRLPTTTLPPQQEATTSASASATVSATTAPTNSEKITESSTRVTKNDGEDKIGGLSRDLFIVLMVIVGVLVLIFLIVIIFIAFRVRRQKKQVRDKASVLYPWSNGYGGGIGDALRLERRNSTYLFGTGQPNGSIYAPPSTIGDADSIRHIRSPSLTPSLLVPFGADSVVALNVNGESRPFVAVPLDAASRAVSGGGRASRSSSLTGFDASLDTGSVGSAASAPAAASNTSGLSRYRSLFARRRSLSAPEELDNAAFERDYDAQASWTAGGVGKRGPRTARTATLSSVGRLESIGEELSSLDSAAVSRYDADGGDYAAAASRLAAAARRASQQPPATGRRSSNRDAAGYPGNAPGEQAPAFDRQGAYAKARRMTMPDRLGAYGETSSTAGAIASPPTPFQSMLPRYSADGRSFTQDGASFDGATEDEDRSDAESSASAGAPTRWPYASRLRLPRTSWSGASGDDAGGSGRPFALPVRKHGWPGRPSTRRQSAL